MSRSITGLTPKPERPEFVADEHLTYLDGLRESGVTNMMGAGTYLDGAFNLERNQAGLILTYWMATFAERHPK
jgi:hypothetical protein